MSKLSFSHKSSGTKFYCEAKSSNGRHSISFSFLSFTPITAMASKIRVLFLTELDAVRVVAETIPEV